MKLSDAIKKRIKIYKISLLMNLSKLFDIY